MVQLRILAVVPENVNLFSRTHIGADFNTFITFITAPENLISGLLHMHSIYSLFIHTDT